ncbi:MAG: hypothetical protein FJ292_07205 [Planctomycetes bacterium]|nr:hypothetical protein [Planctomycetota bacterium]
MSARPIASTGCEQKSSAPTTPKIESSARSAGESAGKAAAEGSKTVANDAKAACEATKPQETLIAALHWRAILACGWSLKRRVSGALQHAGLREAAIGIFPNQGRRTLAEGASHAGVNR